MTTHMANEQRVLQVEGAYNLRDLGGYKTKDGRMTRWGIFFRADGLHKLSTLSQQELVDRGVRTIIDLRNAHELEEKKNVFADSQQVSYHNVSLINPATSSLTQIRNLGDLYINLLQTSQAQLLRVFTLLAEGGIYGSLFHCAAGKDRTGVVSALLLDLGNVPHETILEDYVLTNACISPILEELRKGKPANVPDDMYESFLGCDPAYMVSLLSHLELRYGNAEHYLRTIGLSEGQILTLKEQLLTN
ncbi:tyrosine-protein phosphatase [Paenibacillus oryzisoli]|uniref:Protein tyrosine phosphatase n=1 Tax=Paenibacillus oryzisoli TaxID=1850517 RepID=A0A198A6Q8_9BACL|nr:tyrosine-protein phosphatase [Paenibacillus oryzisoli]OAS16785.1 protein tyrosine phosphatase [Paenibacillus oryzisoli]